MTCPRVPSVELTRNQVRTLRDLSTLAKGHPTARI
jgi:hypothetical protein